MIIMDKDFYRNKLVLQDHLLTSTYELTDNKVEKKVISDLHKLTEKYEACLTNK